MTALAIVPTFIRGDKELEVTIKTLETIKTIEPSLEVMVIDDCSPYEEGLALLEEACDRLSIESLVCNDTNEGFSRTINGGLREALDRGLDAILVNADIEFVVPFLETFTKTLDSQERPAAVVGALLLYPNGLIQHSGVHLSFFDRAFDHTFRYAPGALPEAHVPRVCPVTGALQFIRHSTLETVGLYSEGFRMGFEDVDFCLRTFEAGLECVYQPAVRAIHHESLFRGQRSDKLDEWHQQSLAFLHETHGTTPMARYVLPIA